MAAIRCEAKLEAGHCLRAFRPMIDLLLTDLVMPLMGGKELAEQFKLEHPETKVLYFSGYADDTSLGQVGPGERIPFLQKPFTPASLAQMVRHALDDNVPTRVR